MPTKPKPRYKQDLWSKAKQLFSRGYPSSAVATVLKINRNTARSWAVLSGYLPETPNARATLVLQSFHQLPIEAKRLVYATIKNLAEKDGYHE